MFAVSSFLDCELLELIGVLQFECNMNELLSVVFLEIFMVFLV